jgi:hypothetical protein
MSVVLKPKLMDTRNLGLGGTANMGKTVFDVNPNGNNDEDISQTPISFKKMMEFQI